MQAGMPEKLKLVAMKINRRQELKLNTAQGS